MTKLANMDIFHELLMRSWNPVDVRSDRAAACKMHAFRRASGVRGLVKIQTARLKVETSLS